jgi:hypothetical protein
MYAVTVSNFKFEEYKGTRLYLKAFEGKTEVPLNARVINEPIAKSIGLQAGKSYILSIVESGSYTNPTTGEVKPQYQYNVVSEFTATELMSLVGNVKPEKVVVNEPAELVESDAMPF